MVNKPVIAVLLLFPLKKENQEIQAREEEESKNSLDSIPKDIFFMKQTIGKFLN